ncbi:MAG: FecR domain-containing protein [Sedimentisphaerales bacterium]|nr:FecR domain-containing protein [Sedimentisphaerales bacterium]
MSKNQQNQNNLSNVPDEAVFVCLAYAYLDNQATVQEQDRLKAWLQQYPALRELFIQICMQDQMVYEAVNTSGGFVYQPQAAQEDRNLSLWRELSWEEKNAPAVPQDKTADDTAKIIPDRSRIVPIKHRVNRLSVATIISLAAALLLMMTYIYFHPYASIETATLVDAMNVQWAEEMRMPGPQGRIKTLVPMTLLQGIARIQMDDGVDLVVESPAKFELATSSELRMDYGRVYAYVSEIGRGFTVTTPNSRIVDLGTEFGIQADNNGQTNLHVFQGKTYLVAGTKQNAKTVQTLEAGQARGIQSNGTVRSLRLKTDDFVRSFNPRQNVVWKGQPLDLADMVGGGNGFGTGTINKGYHLTTGNALLFDGPVSVSNEGSYSPIFSNPFVDGVFIPIGPGQIVSSLGHQFDDCPATNGGAWSGTVFNGALHYSYSNPKIYRHQLRLAGKAYGVAGNPAINMHANCGITFNLDEIRRLVPGYDVGQFTSLYGISETFFDFYDVRDIPDIVVPRVDFFVLVDGKVRFSKKSVAPEAGKRLLAEVPLLPGDRFLTLITTQSDDPYAISYDWALFAEPQLVLTRVSQ